LPEDRIRSAALYLRHYRYYYDPPEFQTVITTTDRSKLFLIGDFTLVSVLRIWIRMGLVLPDPDQEVVATKLKE